MYFEKILNFIPQVNCQHTINYFLNQHIFSQSWLYKSIHIHTNQNTNTYRQIKILPRLSGQILFSHGLPKAFLLTSIHTGLSLSIPLPPLPPTQPSRKIQCKESITSKRDFKVIVKQLNIKLELLRQRFDYKC